MSDTTKKAHIGILTFEVCAPTTLNFKNLRKWELEDSNL